MVTLLMNLLSACLRRPASKKLLGGGSDALGQQNGLLWYKDFGQHVNGEFSMAVFQANKLLEDRSQIESGSLSLMDSGPFGSFVGIYDGHGGPEVAQYITNHLFGHIKRLMTEQQSMSVDVIRKAIQATEDGFFSLVSQQWPLNPHIASVGSCCLIGIVCDGAIYVSNLGDSRAVLGRLVKATGEILAMQLSAEHNASIESIRKELQSMHPNDPQIVVQKYNVWRVKGLIQISRSIGDAFLKKAEYNREPLDAKFRLRETFRKPILSAEPSISVQTVHPNDQFIIFASDGLWEQISNQDAVNIVQNNPRKVCQFQVTGRVRVEPGTDPALFGSTRTRPDPLWIRQRHAGSRFGVRQQQRATTMRGELDRGTRVRGTVPMAGHTADMTGELGTVAMGS